MFLLLFDIKSRLENGWQPLLMDCKEGYKTPIDSVLWLSYSND